MSTTLNTTTEIHRTTRTDRRSPQRTTSIGPVVTSAPAEAEELLAKRPASELTRLIFCALLGIAACLALVGVVSQASTTSPDAPAPAVIVDFD